MKPDSSFQLKGSQDYNDKTIDSTIGTRLKLVWSDIPQEPLSATLALAVEGLTMPRASQRLGALQKLASNPWVPILAIPSVIACLLMMYLIKSAAGIDILDGPSPLHYLFFE